MTPESSNIAAPAIVATAARCWRSARSRSLPAQHCLHILLYPHRADMLAPVFDSLMTLYEAALGRPFVAGSGQALTSDERLLCGLLDGSRPRRECLDCPAGPARALDCAICSTRIMMGLMLDRAEGAVLQ